MGTLVFIGLIVYPPVPRFLQVKVSKNGGASALASRRQKCLVAARHEPRPTGFTFIERTFLISCSLAADCPARICLQNYGIIADCLAKTGRSRPHRGGSSVDLRQRSSSRH